MKTLSFAADQGLLYQYASQAIINPKYQLAGPAEIRAHAKLSDALESIGVRGEDGGYTLRPDGGAIHLEGTQFALLRKMVEATPPFPALSRQIVPFYDMLDSAPDYTPPPSPPIE